MRCLARPLLYAIVAVLAIGQMLVACGQKGDLYLPKDDAPPAAAAHPDATVPDADSSAESLDAIDDVPSDTPGPNDL